MMLCIPSCSIFFECPLSQLQELTANVSYNTFASEGPATAVFMFLIQKVERWSDIYCCEFHNKFNENPSLVKKLIKA